MSDKDSARAEARLMTLHDAKNSIRDHLSRGIIELL